MLIIFEIIWLTFGIQEFDPKDLENINIAANERLAILELMTPTKRWQYFLAYNQNPMSVTKDLK